MYAYLVIVADEHNTEYYCLESKALVQQSIDITWSKVPEQKPELIWNGNNATAGDYITVRLIEVADRPDHL